MSETDGTLASVTRKMRNFAIIAFVKKLNTDAQRVLGSASLSDLGNISFTEAEKALLASAPETHYPAIFTETYRKLAKTPKRYIDPARQNAKVTLGIWYQMMWLPFAHLNLQPRDPADTQSTLRASEVLLNSALSSYIDEFGRRSAQAFIDRLWQHRWIFDSQVCAIRRLNVVAPSQVDLQNLADDGTEANRAFDQVRQCLEDSRERSTSLDEWAEALYILGPMVHYAKYLYDAKSNQDRDDMACSRLLSEISADIFALFHFIFVMDILPNSNGAWTSMVDHPDFFLK